MDRTDPCTEISARATLWAALGSVPGRAAVDRFDEMRGRGSPYIRAPRRFSVAAELLARRIQARQRAIATAVPDPHDDTVIPPLWLRAAKSPASQVELLALRRRAVGTQSAAVSAAGLPST